MRLETLHLENQKLRAEIAEMTGDDMRASSSAPPPPARQTSHDVSSTSTSSSQINHGHEQQQQQQQGRSTSPQPLTSSKVQSVKTEGVVSTASSRSAVAAKELHVAAHRAEVEEAVGALKELLYITLGIIRSHFNYYLITLLDINE